MEGIYSKKIPQTPVFAGGPVVRPRRENREINLLKQ
jgi:hypothetical protein